MQQENELKSNTISFQKTGENCYQGHVALQPGDGQAPLTREAITQRIAAELDHAYAKHGRDQWGRHEFYAILREEVDELWEGIKHDDPQAETIDEALQVAAMVFRYLETGDRYRQPSNATEMSYRDKV